jgi:hypothetical protein
MMRRWLYRLSVACALGWGLIAVGCASSMVRDQPAAPPEDIFNRVSKFPAAKAVVVEAIALDRKGAQVVDMRPADFLVTVDGRRPVDVAMGRLYRGPGASALRDMQDPDAPDVLPPVIEPNRLIVIVVDQASLLPGDERRARLVVESCLTHFGLTERVVVVALAGSEGSETMASDRSAIRQTLGRLRGLRMLDAASALPPPPEPDREVERPERIPDTASGEAVRPASSGRPTSRPDDIPTLDSMKPEVRAGSREVLSPAVSLAHATSALKGLLEVSEDLRAVPGSKTILLVSAGMIADGADQEVKAVIESASRSFTRIYALQLPTSAPVFAEKGRALLQVLADETGGALVTLTSKPDQALQRMAGELSMSYLLMLLPREGETLPGSPRVQVGSRRKNVVVRVARRAVAGGYASLLSVTPGPPASRPAMGRPPLTPVPGPGPAASRWPVDPGLLPILARVSDYVVGYGHELSAVVAEEVYEQEWHNPKGGTTKRRLASDFLLVRIPGLQGWVPFRDVYEVDGEKVRDRADRLVKLFLSSTPESAAASASGVWVESARYNLGGVQRTVNVPVLPLIFVEPVTRNRFEFRKSGEETIGGVRAWVLDYRETAKPTIIKTSKGEDVPAFGRFWIEPVSGRVLRSLLQASSAEITVTYGPREELPGLWPPVMMREVYKHPSGEITATATYSKFRRFQVQTQEQLKIPKRP